MTSRRSGWSGYRPAALLAGLVVLGWLWDLALGGGRAHALGWSVALVVVGGIGLLAGRARARAGTPDAGRQARPPVPPTTGVVIEPATPAELPRLVEVEIAADTLFEVAGYGRTPGPAGPDELAAAALVLVARHPLDQAGQADPIGYVQVELVDGQPHIEGLSVRPRNMRRGVGTALVEAACRWAAERGYRQITLCTFADVPWNGPFYARQGFTEITDIPPGVRELRRREAELGLDAMGRRCVLRRELGPSHQVWPGRGLPIS
jgi:GNAT superfamily N-acetyltransferase